MSNSKSMSSHVGELMNQLPIAKHFGGGDELMTSTDKMKKGERNIYNLIRLALLGTVGYFTWMYVLPPVFIALGKFAAVTAVGVAAITLFAARKGIGKWIKRFAKGIHKAAIRNAPFEELDIQLEKLDKNKQNAYAAHGRIKQLRKDMQIEAKLNEEKAESLQAKILSESNQARDMQDQLNKWVETEGAEVQSTDKWVNLNADLRKLLSKSMRTQAVLKQSQGFVSKYGTRANVLKQVSHRMTMVEVAMDNKVEDFKTTIEILKNDYEAAAKMKDATGAAKAAMMFDKSWELEYAVDIVTNTIAEDIAITSGNFNDINTLTIDMDMNNDEMFAKLDKLAEDIESGANVTPDASAYNKDDYRLTEEDTLNSGGFENIY